MTQFQGISQYSINEDNAAPQENNDKFMADEDPLSEDDHKDEVNNDAKLEVVEFNPIFVKELPIDSHGIWPRIKEEFALLLAQLHLFLLCMFVNIYGNMVYRNIAFYNYYDEPPLSWRMKDLGFEILPEFPEEYHGYGSKPKEYL